MKIYFKDEVKMKDFLDEYDLWEFIYQDEGSQGTIKFRESVQTKVKSMQIIDKLSNDQGIGLKFVPPTDGKPSPVNIIYSNGSEEWDNPDWEDSNNNLFHYDLVRK